MSVRQAFLRFRHHVRCTVASAGVVGAVAFIVACGHSAASPAAPTATSAVQPAPATGCARTSTGLIPLTQMGASRYQGEAGGLYPGSNIRPGNHEAAGVALARNIGPLNAGGLPDASGRYAFVSIGMSNTTQEFSTFKTFADADASKNPRLVIVDGAQGGMTAALWASASCPCWTVLDDRLRLAGIAPGQVTVIWLKEANAGPTRGFPTEALTLRDQTAEMSRMLKARFPNLVLAYVSSRIYAGYATSTLNPEPYAYESAFAMKWLIEQQLSGGGLEYGVDGHGVAPWLSWGPYLWADGLVARADGLTWACGDLQSSDGTHPSTSGRQKVADMLLQFVRTDSTARLWYLAHP